MISSLLYDIKRTFLRPVILLLIILFALMGIAVTYVTYITMARHPLVDGIAIIVNNNNTCIFIGGVFDKKGEPIEATLTFIRENERVYMLKSSGVFIIKNEEICRYIDADITIIEIDTAIQKINTTNVFRYLIYPSTITVYSSSYYDYLQYNSILIFFKLFLTDIKSMKAKVYMFTIDIESPDLRIRQPITIGYKLMPLTSHAKTEFYNDSLDLSIKYEVKDYIESYTLTLDFDKDIIKFFIKDINTSESQHQFATHGINYKYMTYTNIAYIGMIIESINPYMMFFPIGVLYLVYIFIAKSRSSGALEFVLARPITRSGLYFSRYIAGLATIFIATSVFIIINATFCSMIIRISLDFWSYILLYLGVVASLATFYTICYAIASMVRSSLYLSLSIIIYLLLSIFWGIIIMIIAFTKNIQVTGSSFYELSYTLSYLNPLQFTSLAEYFILLSYEAIPEIHAVNPILCIVTPVIWITVFLILGHTRFKKINLHS